MLEPHVRAFMEGAIAGLDASPKLGVARTALGDVYALQLSLDLVRQQAEKARAQCVKVLEKYCGQTDAPIGWTTLMMAGHSVATEQPIRQAEETARSVQE